MQGISSHVGVSVVWGRSRVTNSLRPYPNVESWQSEILVMVSMGIVSNPVQVGEMKEEHHSAPIVKPIFVGFAASWGNQVGSGKKCTLSQVYH